MTLQVANLWKIKLTVALGANHAVPIDLKSRPFSVYGKPQNNRLPGKFKRDCNFKKGVTCAILT